MKPFTAEEARRSVLARVNKAGPKGAPGLFAASASEEKRTLLLAAAAALEHEQALFADRRRSRPRYFAWEYRPELPTVEGVAARLVEIARADYPALSTRPRWKAALKKQPGEAALLEPALAQARANGRLVQLLLRKARGAEEVFIPALAVAAPPPELDAENVHRAYTALAARTGFPAVAISQLCAESAASLPALQAWLRSEHAAGRAIFSRGDWSLAEPDKRLAAVEWQGQAHLLVRLLPT